MPFSLSVGQDPRGRHARGGARRRRLRQSAEGPGGRAMAGAATPGSAQEFQVNVGDRVFFETDSSALTPQAQATLDRQVQWLNQYSQLRLHRRRPRRRARHARIQPRARRPPRHRGARLHDRARHRRQPHAHRLLRQGAAGRRLRRHLLLVAEPPRRHGARRRRLTEFPQSPRKRARRAGGPFHFHQCVEVWPNCWCGCRRHPIARSSLP